MEPLWIIKRSSVDIVSMGTRVASLITFVLLLQSAFVAGGASKKTNQLNASPLDTFQELKKTDTCGAVGIDDFGPTPILINSIDLLIVISFEL